MALFWNIVLSIVSWFMLLIFLHYGVIIRISNFERRAWFLRAEFVFIIESALGIASYIVWNAFINLPSIVSYQPTGAKKSKKNSINHKLSDVDLTSHYEGKNFIGYGDQEKPQKWTLWHLGVAIIIFMAHLSYFTNLFLIGVEPHWFSMLCYACLGIEMQCFVGIVLISCISYLLKLIKWALSSKPDHTESGIPKKYASHILILYILLASMTGLYNASQPPPVKHVTIPVKDLPENLQGLRIVQLSDIHLGPTVGYSKLQMIISIAVKEKPDLLIITGDLVDGSVAQLKEAADPLRSLNPKYGKLYVTGNHEYYTGDVDNWFRFLNSLNFNVLHNSNIKIPQKVSSNEKQICFAGTDDVQADIISYGNHKFDIMKAVSGCDENLPSILLAHQPKAAKKALDAGVRLDVIFSGHTHGGQMFPLMFLSYFANPFFAGLYKIEGRDTHVYVSTGTQYWGIPMRIATSMEITSTTLQKL